MDLVDLDGNPIVNDAPEIVLDGDNVRLPNAALARERFPGRGVNYLPTNPGIKRNRGRKLSTRTARGDLLAQVGTGVDEE